MARKPQQQAFMVHFFPSVKHSCPQANPRTTPPPRATVAIPLSCQPSTQSTKQLSKVRRSAWRTNPVRESDRSVPEYFNTIHPHLSLNLVKSPPRTSHDSARPAALVLADCTVNSTRASTTHETDGVGSTRQSRVFDPK